MFLKKIKNGLFNTNFFVIYININFKRLYNWFHSLLHGERLKIARNNYKHNN